MQRLTRCAALLLGAASLPETPGARAQNVPAAAPVQAAPRAPIAAPTPLETAFEAAERGDLAPVERMLRTARG